MEIAKLGEDSIDKYIDDHTLVLPIPGIVLLQVADASIELEINTHVLVSQPEEISAYMDVWCMEQDSNDDVGFLGDLWIMDNGEHIKTTWERMHPFPDLEIPITIDD